MLCECGLSQSSCLVLTLLLVMMWDDTCLHGEVTWGERHRPCNAALGHSVKVTWTWALSHSNSQPGNWGSFSMTNRVEAGQRSDWCPSQDRVRFHQTTQKSVQFKILSLIVAMSRHHPTKVTVLFSVVMTMALSIQAYCGHIASLIQNLEPEVFWVVFSLWYLHAYISWGWDKSLNRKFIYTLYIIHTQSLRVILYNNLVHLIFDCNLIHEVRCGGFHLCYYVSTQWVSCEHFGLGTLTLY